MPHDPSRPSESIEYKIMTLGQVCSGGKVSDGGHYNAYRKHGGHIALRQELAQTKRLIERMRRRKTMHYSVICEAFGTKQGDILETRLAAQALDMSQNKYLRLYGEALCFVEGALDRLVA